ncbi:beta-2-glycoprotein 1-like [Eucyclogobius newberryi]|uniref:beta-2-glycoprotein 1-like n=1 Tax=Eucyclogobius newberryi TaxID=166745 RepID=UPI003B5C663C
MKGTLWLLLCSFLFWINITRAEDNVCSRPVLGDNVKFEAMQRFVNPGVEVVLSCETGYTSFLGPRTIICKASGTWTKTQFRCKPVQCSNPDPPMNGNLYYENTLYQSIVNYTCDDGYILKGANNASCLADGRWSAQEPQCKIVSCGPAPIPEFGMIIYNKIIRKNNLNYGTIGNYKCLPPFALFGKEFVECTASGQWTETPQCREVSCPPPENIDNGYMSIPEKRDFGYGETINYGCNDDYVLDGRMQIVCEETGDWSEKPSCKAPCSIGIKRGRIEYRGRKLWLDEFKPNKVLHRETVSVYCMNKARRCEYAFPTQCVDGNLQIPECFKGNECKQKL